VAKSLIIPFIELKPENLSILQISANVIKAIKSLSQIEDCFKRIYFISDSSKYRFIDIEDIDAINKLANEILESELKDIKKIDKVESPDISYSRKNGFIFSLQFMKDEQKCISLNFRVGSVRDNQIGVISMNPSLFLDFKKLYLYLSACIDSLEVRYATLKISELAFAREVKKYRYPIGWISYFSKDFEMLIPDDLEDIEYEHTEKGKYLILTREDFTVDKESYETHKQKLLDLMEEIKQRIPEYSK